MNRIALKNKIKLDEVILKEKEVIDGIKSKFFANISHEFRTPLTLILGPAEKIEKNQSTNPVKDARIITRNSKRLLQLVNQLLDLSKLDAGKLKLEASAGNIVSFVKGTALSFESFSESRDVLLRIKSDKEFIEVYFDREKMIKVLSNLLSNAFKFTPQMGNVIITITETLDKTVEIKIRNNGVGIQQKELPKLFDRFYQVDSSQTKEYEGTGIGLALVRELIELHHGTITVDSETGDNEKPGWTEFTIILPLGRAHLKDDEITTADKDKTEKNTTLEEEKYLSPKALVESEPVQDNTKTMVLVVEDNYDMRQYIKESLSDSYVVEEAVNGEQGVRIAENIVPDLIISDLMMPKMDGNELARILKNDERTSHIPIIILTAKSGQENKIEGLQTGADDYLTKPFDLQELRVRVENLINIRKKLQEKFSKGEFLSKPAGKKLKSIDEKFLARVLEVIEKHLSEEDFSIEECSSEVGMSRTHLHKKLRALVGKSPSQYVRTVRLYRAKLMIEEEKGNISEVAYSVGFSSPAYFSKCFKDQFGYPPSNIMK
jgi:CheY-like chemotaxis protein/AraC-like DNA-binding protein/nitrogen-specific signal transduction histidine kinase